MRAYTQCNSLNVLFDRHHTTFIRVWTSLHSHTILHFQTHTSLIIDTLRMITTLTRVHRARIHIHAPRSQRPVERSVQELRHRLPHESHLRLVGSANMLRGRLKGVDQTLASSLLHSQGPNSGRHFGYSLSILWAR